MSRGYYRNHGKGTGICEICCSEYTKTNSKQRFCQTCYNKIKHATSSSLKPSPYHRTSDHSTEHRNLIKQISNGPVSNDAVIHHLDLNTRNNELSNLVVFSRSDHIRFHLKLNQYIVKYKDSNILDLSEKVMIDCSIYPKEIETDVGISHEEIAILE